MTATSVEDAKLERTEHARRTDIQGLRAVAVGLVVLSHIGISRLSGGFIGVDVFFVISGFLITQLLLREAENNRAISLTAFYARRARRILPMSTIVLLSTALAAFFILGRVRATEIMNETIWATLFAANWKFSLDGTDYFNNDLPPSPLQHYWSLAVEEQFYIVWPGLIALLVFGLAAFRRHESGPRRQHRTVPALVVMLVITAVSFGYGALYTSEQPTAAYFSTLTRVWELGVGAALALGAVYVAAVPTAARAVASWAGLAGVVVSVLVIDEATPFPGMIAALPVLSTALVLAGGIGSARWGAGIVLSLPPFRLIGDISYSLYLWHWPLLILTPSYVGRDLTLAEKSGLMVGAVLLSIGTYRLVEKPIQDRSKKAPQANGLLLWPASVVILLVVVMMSIDSLRRVETVNAAPSRTIGGAAPDSPVDPLEEAVRVAVQQDGPVPDLTPPLSEVRDDSWRGPETLDDACISGPGQTSADLCPVGPEGRTIVLFGDSQGGMWWPAVKKIAEDRGWRALPIVKTACGPADVLTWNQAASKPDEDCQEWRQWALSQIEQARPDVVLVSNRRTRVVGADGQPLPDKLGLAEWEKGMTATLTRLKATSGRVVQFHDQPRVEDDPVDCLDARDATLAGCAFELPDDAKQTSAANERAAKTAGVEYVDLTSWFCASNRCPLVIDGAAVYFSPGHITRTTGLRLAPHLADRLQL